MAGRYASLFTGAGGLDLGLEAAGWEPLWFCENAKACRKVLGERWPDVPVFLDVARVGLDTDLDDEPVDLLVGGFPCQDLSYAGKRAGLEGDRSGLWFEMARVIRLLQPRMVLVENVPGLMRPVRGGSGIAPVGVVLADLAELGFDARWGRLRASDVGAPHIRSRVFVVGWQRALADAVSERQDWSGGPGSKTGAWGRRVVAAGSAALAADASSRRGAWYSGAALGPEEQGWGEEDGGDGAGDLGEDDADADGGRRERVGEPEPRGLEGEAGDELDGRSEERGLEDAASAADSGGERGKPGKRRRAQGGSGARSGSTQRERDGHDGPAEQGSDAATPDAAGGGRGEDVGSDDAGRGEPDVAGSGARGDAADADDAERAQQRGPEPTRAEQRSAGRGGGAPAFADGAHRESGEGGCGEIPGAEIAGGAEVEPGGCAGGGEGRVTVDWGIFQPAIERWEWLFRDSPPPTDDLGRLNPRFSEWMLGYPGDWVNVKGVSRTAQLRMLGNSCQVQCGTALGLHLSDMLEAFS